MSLGRTLKFMLQNLSVLLALGISPSSYGAPPCRSKLACYKTNVVTCMVSTNQKPVNIRLHLKIKTENKPSKTINYIVSMHAFKLKKNLGLYNTSNHKISP